MGKGKLANLILHNLLAFFVIVSMLATARAQFIQQGGKLVATGAIGNSQQGFSLALSADGNTAIVGGSEDNGGIGAAWVFTRTAGLWTQEAKLVGTGAIGKAGQGVSVALSGDGNTAIIGGTSDNCVTSSSGPPAEANNCIGAAWVFTRTDGVWVQQGEKLAGTGYIGTSPSQGQSVALSGDGNTAIIGGENDNGGIGAAWVFTRTNGVWAQQGDKLVGTGYIGRSPLEGQAVALSADGYTALLGGPGDNNAFSQNATVGAVWVFTRSGNVWIQQGAKLVGTGAIGQAGQGRSVALSGDGSTAIIGDSCGVSQPTPPSTSCIGAAWVFTRSGNIWSQQGAKLVGTDAAGFADQGWSVALSADGGTAIIGGPYDSGGTGAAWEFTRSGNVWTQRGAKLVGTGAAGLANQGISVALSGDGQTVLVGGYADKNFVGAAWAFSGGLAPPVVTGVVNDAGFMAGTPISPGSWVAIFGTGLAPTGDSRTWNVGTEIVNGNLPLSLDGTSVTVNGKPAVVEFVSASQVNIETPDDTAVGPVLVVVNTPAGASNAFTVNYATFAPGLFSASAPYLVAQHADYSFVTAAAPAKPGEVIILWGTGFGPATPVVLAGQVFSGANPLANVVTVTISGRPAQVDFAGVVGAGLAQINVHVPSSINDGDAPVVATVGGVSTQMTANMISIHN